MKNPRLQLMLLGAAVAIAAGCSHLDLATAGNTDRVLTGQVILPRPVTLPPGSVLVVRVIDPNPTPLAAPPLQTSAAPPVASNPEVLGEQTIQDLGEGPFPFRIEYRADDDALRRGLTVEARITSGGRLSYSNTGSNSIGLSDVTDPHRILVDRVGP